MKELLNELELIVASELKHSTEIEYYQFLKKMNMLPPSC